MTVLSNKTDRFRRRLIVSEALTVAFLLLPLCILWFDPQADQIGQAQSFCPLKLLTGLPCPGCGIIKSQVFLYQGNFMESLRYHAFGIPVTLALWVAVGVMAYQWVGGVSLHFPRLYSMRLAIIIALLWGSYHLTRLVIFVSTHTLTQILQESVWT